jgi:hypothetical protein
MATWRGEQHPRDNAGRFSATGSARRAAEQVSAETTGRERAQLSRLSGARTRKLYEKALENGGITYDLMHDTYPDKGFSVSIHPDHEKTIAGKVSETDLETYVRDHGDFIAATPGAHLGMWYDVQADKWYLDVTHVEPNRDRAIELAQTHNQEGIYDLEKGETIITKDAGKRRL